MPKWIKFYIFALIVVFLGLCTAYIVEADELPEKKEIEKYETFDRAEFLTPEEGGTSKYELPLYQIKNANILFDSYDTLLASSNEIVKEVNEEIIPAYNEIYDVAKEKNKQLQETRNQRDLYHKIMIYEGIALGIGVFATVVYLSVR